MTIIDSQVHAYEANTPKRPWHSVPNWPAHVTGDEMVASMNKVGVDGAIFISAFSLYQYDASYAVEVQKAHPDRMAIVTSRLDPLGEFYRRCFYHNLDFELRTGRSMSMVVENEKIISVADARRKVAYARAQGWLA